jgi:predicted nucleic acid-binding protein
MSGFLIDTNILSEYNRPGGPDAGVKRWLETADRQSQHVSVITLAEIQKGIELLAEGKRRTLLELWLKEDLETWFSSRILSVDRPVASHWASLMSQAIRRGKPLPTVDSLIAATALAHGLIVTRNVRDFQDTGATVLNPWEAA